LILNKDILKGIEYVQYLQNILKENPLIFPIINNELQNSQLDPNLDLNQTGQQIESSISLLEKGHYFIFDEINFEETGTEQINLGSLFDKWVTFLMSRKSQLSSQFMTATMTLNENEIMLLIKQLLDLINDSNQKFFTSIINYLTTMERTRNNIERVKVNVERAIQLSKSSNIHSKPLFISFPSPMHLIDSQRTQHQQFCEILIHYAKILNLIRQIDQNNDPIQCLYLLFEYPDFTAHVKDLEQFIWFHPSEIDSPIRKKLIFFLQSFLKACTFYSLFSLKSEYLIKPSTMITEFDIFMDRNEINDYNIPWAYQMSTKFSPDFMIQIPRFLPLYLIPLFVQLKEEKYFPGFFFPQIQRIPDNFLSQIFSINVASIHSLVEMLNVITKIAFQELIQEEIEDDYENAILKAIRH
jgi:hypothetical protein